MINNFDISNINKFNNELKDCNLYKQIEGEDKKKLGIEKSLDNVCTQETNPSVDEQGHVYRKENGDWLPNNNFVKGENTFKTDDNGKIYKIDGKLVPENKYELNCASYETDELGRIRKVVAQNLKLTPENLRDSTAQTKVGGKDRLLGEDNGGHLVARTHGGDAGIGNLVALRDVINKGDWKVDENTISDLIKNGKNVRTEAEIFYDGNSERPSKIEISIYSNGEKISEAVYDNNKKSKDLLGLEKLKDILSPSDYQNLCDEISQLEKNGDEVSITSVTFKPGEDPSIAVRNETTKKTCYWPWNTRNEGKTLSDVFHNS